MSPSAHSMSTVGQWCLPIISNALSGTNQYHFTPAFLLILYPNLTIIRPWLPFRAFGIHSVALADHQSVLYISMWLAISVLLLLLRRSLISFNMIELHPQKPVTTTRHRLHCNVCKLHNSSRLFCQDYTQDTSSRVYSKANTGTSDSAGRFDKASIKADSFHRQAD